MKYPHLLQRHAFQQPRWVDLKQLAQVRNVLSVTETLTNVDQVLELRRWLERVSRGEALVLQAGDCAEHPDECTEQDIAAKRALVHQLADILSAATDRPVVRVGRIGGQFAKPRSNPVDEMGGTALPAYRGHMINAPEFDPLSRRAEPLRMLMCFMAAREAVGHLGWRVNGNWAECELENLMWTSHEALVLDYEQPQVHRVDRHLRILGSTHWPWIGDRTRQVYGAHVDLLRKVVNPVGCKVGPDMKPAELLELCHWLDPQREPGRLALIVRMGADHISDRLPALVRAVRDEGHPVLWLSDPMHANTVKRVDGTKTREVTTILKELRQFLAVLGDAEVQAHGLHLEATPYPVTECVGYSRSVSTDVLVNGSPSLCDPRLNREQGLEVATAFGDVSRTTATTTLASEAKQS